MFGSVSRLDVEDLRVLRQLDQEPGNDGDDVGFASGRGGTTDSPHVTKPFIDTIESIRWVKRTSSGSVTNSSRQDAEEVIKKMNMPADHYVVYTRASTDSESSGTLFKFDNYVQTDALNHGPDMTSGDITSYPGFAIGYIHSGCAASLIGPYHALTAAECVYNTTSHQWNTKLNLLRGRNCDTYLQYMVWKSVMIPYQYFEHSNKEFNWAYIEYDSHQKSPVWLSITYDPELTNRFTPVIINGYTSSKPNACLYSSICILATNRESDRLVQLGCDVFTSFPGAPIMANDYLVSVTKSPPVYALGTWSDNTSLSPVVRISKSMFWLLSYWMRDSGYNPECQKRRKELKRIIIPFEE